MISIGSLIASEILTSSSPIPSSVSPNTGSTTGGTAITITGTGFVSPATAALSGTACTSVVVVNSTTITAVTGARAAGATTLRVTNTATGFFGDLPSAFTYSAAVTPPTLTSVSTSGGAVGDIDGGYPATLTGTNFTGATGVTFGGTAATSLVVVNATTITCVVPAHATGAVSVVVTNPGGSNGANTLFRYFSPAELTSCTSWQRASFTTAPWAATASAGTSGTTGTWNNGVTPSAGTAVNGRTPATFNGTTQYLVGTNQLPSYINGGVSSVVSLFKPATAKAAAVSGSEYLDPALWGDYTNGGLGLTYSSLGFGGYFFSAGTYNPIRKASAVGSWASVFFTWDSTNLNLTVNGSAATPVACGAFGASLANIPAIGSSYANTGMLQGDMLESLTFNVKLSAQNILDIRSYFNTRHFPAGATV